jgi:integrase
MGCIYWDGLEKAGRVIRPGCWAIRYKDVDGSTKKKRTAFTTRTEYDRTKAERELQDIEDAVDRAARRGLLSVAESTKAPSPVTLKQAAKEYIDAQANPKTKKTYQSTLDNQILTQLGNMTLVGIKPADVIRFIEARQKDGASIGTIRKDLAVLSGIFTVAQIKEQVDRNPVSLARKAKKKSLKLGKKLIRWLSQDEETRLYASLPPRARSILRDAIPFSLLTGLRAMEEARLLWDDYDPSRRVIAIRKQKNGNQDELPLCDAAAAILERLRAEAMQEGKGAPAAIQKRHIFQDPESKAPLTRFNNTGWTRALKKAGIEDFRWHDLRHTFASRLAMAGVSLQRMQKLMRHHSITQTLDYAHLCPEDNAAGAAGVDFKGRKDVAVLDCYQAYPDLLFGVQPLHDVSAPPQGAGVLKTVLRGTSPG